MSNAVTVVIPSALRERAKDHRVNISQVCRDALLREVLKKENETGIAPPTATLPAADSMQGGAHEG